MISTRDLSAMPDIPHLRRLTRALATLDAILESQPEYRYYRFDSRWRDGEMMASMQNGSGDEWQALFCVAGVAIHGLAHEAPLFTFGQPRAGIFEGLPAEFHDNFLHEPAFDTSNTTFCIWRLATSAGWSSGSMPVPSGDDPDGSASLLDILEGQPEQYAGFAAEYYERDVDVAAVAAIYGHVPLSASLVRRLNPAASLPALAGDLERIGYPEVGQLV